MYADYEFYSQTYKGKMPEEEAVKALEKSCRHIDTLTYNRIVAKGFENLSEYQQNVIKVCACEMADFENDNYSLINSLVNSYSINGASISFNGDSANCKIVNGVVVQKDTYSFLENTGLTCRKLGV